MSVPLQSVLPIDTTAGSVESLPIRNPADARIEPEVSTVGKAKLSVSHIASLIGFFVLTSIYLLDITMA